VLHSVSISVSGGASSPASSSETRKAWKYGYLEDGDT
jgi:hypothetical protein